jgi:hypothetical protein
MAIGEMSEGGGKCRHIKNSEMFLNELIRDGFRFSIQELKFQNIKYTS